MRVVIAGGHGQVARRLTRLLAAQGHHVVALVRQHDHIADVETDGAHAGLVDLERADAAEVATAMNGADAVIFAAGAGPGSGTTRKDTVDRAAAVLTAEAAERVGVQRYLQVSAMGTEQVRGRTPSEGEDVFTAYLRAKAAAEDDLRTRQALDWTILRPGRLTNDPPTGRVRLGPSVPRGSVTRDDVARVLAALLPEQAAAGRVLELVGGDTPIDQAVAALREEIQET